MKNADVWQISFCATVGLCIESNVVGYQTKDVREGLSQQACTFDQIGVSGGALDIQKLIPVDSEGNYVGDGEINIQFYSHTGAFQKSYAYYGEGEWDGENVSGWFDEDEGVLAVYSFDAGEAFQVYGNSACRFVYSGEVNMAETDVPVREGLSFQANIRPCSTSIQNIVPVDDGGDYVGDGEVNIQFYSNTGKFLRSYAYYGAGEWDGENVAGWFDEDEGTLADYTFLAAEGFKVYTNTAANLRFPEM